MNASESEREQRGIKLAGPKALRGFEEFFAGVQLEDVAERLGVGA